jgi:succinate dehydrogenase/fumarate reductase flavoprotein subunit
MADTDIVIIGAGAAGLSAALAAHEAGASVQVFEKGAQIGGTAAISGGIIWMPQNTHAQAAGIQDSRDDAMAYFMSLDHGDIDPDILGSFVDNGPEALSFLESIGAMELMLMESYPDYYLDRPGAKPEGGRALDNTLYSFHDLGEWAGKVYAGADIQRMMLKETPLGGATGMISPEEFGARAEKDLRGWGQALIGRMLKACLDRGIPIHLEHSAQRLLEEDGRIVGARFTCGDDTITANANKGVIIATGGFEWNKGLSSTFLRGPMTAPASPPGNTGDGLKLAMRAGAALGNMTSAWWMTSMKIPGDAWPANGENIPSAERALPVLIERTLPHTMMVNAAGERFCNEANNYSALAGAFQSFDPATYDYPNLPAYLVFDQQYRDQYPFGPIMPGQETPNWVYRADTMEDLAALLGVDAEALKQTQERFNSFAQSGEDEDFGRGASDYDRFYGDRRHEGAGATLGEINTPPYYAVPIEIGALGTNGGAKTNANAQVLDLDGTPLPGLYAAGNVMAAATGSVYAGAGGTLGPTLTFGVVAGRAAAQ